jgi:hypothetical protein
MTDVIMTADKLACARRELAMRKKGNANTRLERSAGAGGGCALGTRASPNCEAVP